MPNFMSRIAFVPPWAKYNRIDSDGGEPMAVVVGFQVLVSLPRQGNKLRMRSPLASTSRAEGAPGSPVTLYCLDIRMQDKIWFV
jgi:hypothetical protein